jgi:hypothetical protein
MVDGHAGRGQRAVEPSSRRAYAAAASAAGWRRGLTVCSNSALNGCGAGIDATASAVNSAGIAAKAATQKVAARRRRFTNIETSVVSADARRLT